MKKTGTCAGIMLIVTTLLGILFPLQIGAKTLESVQGRGCHTYSDDETPNDAEKKAKLEAREEAVSSHSVLVEAFTEVENFQLKNDSIQTAAVGMLHALQWGDVDWQGRKACIALQALLEVDSVKNELERRIQQKKIKDDLASSTLTTEASSGLQIWLNKADGQYVEDEQLEVHVKSNRDVYLKLDYFQADGTVVHMVPNMFGERGFIRKGETYIFGNDDSPERFVISPPFGEEIIKAVVSPRPFTDHLQTDQTISQSRAYVDTLKNGLNKIRTRGLRDIFEASVPLYTISRKVQEHQQALQE